jgi:hypothetical protein
MRARCDAKSKKIFLLYVKKRSVGAEFNQVAAQQTVTHAACTLNLEIGIICDGDDHSSLSFDV